MSLAQYLNAVTDPCMAVFCGVAAVYVLMTRGSDPKSARFLFGALITGLVLNVMDTLAYYFHGDATETAYVMARTAKFISIACLFVMIAFETGYLWRRTKLRGGTESIVLRIAALSLCGIGITALILSRIFHFYYTFDDQNRYMRTDYYWVHMVIVGMAMLMMLLYTIRNRKIYHRREYSSFLCMSLLPAVVLIIQRAMVWGGSLYSVSFSAAILVVFLAYRVEASETTMIRESLKLTNENIFMVFEGLDRFMLFFDMEQRNRFQVRITVEEVLLRMKDRFGEDEVFDIFSFTSFGRPQIRIEKKGEMFNPLSKEGAGMMNWSGSLLTSIGLNPVYSYAGGKNILRLPLQRMQMNPALKMVIALFIGIVAGYMGVRTLSSADQLFVSEEVLRPIYDLMSSLLYCATGPILFLMVVTVILDTVGISSQGGSSLAIVSRYFILSYAMGLAALASLLCVMGNALGETNLGKNDAQTLFNGLLSIVPKNVFAPFVEANTPQLMVMAIMLGLATAVLGAKATGLTDVIRQGNLVGMQVAQWIGRIIPYFAIAMAALIYMTGHQIELVILIPVLLGSVVITILCMLAVIGYISMKEDVRPGILIKKCRPSFLNALRSGSLDTSYGLAERCCTVGLGVERHFASVSLPLGLVMYMPANVVGTLLFIMYAAVRSDVTISLVWMLMSVALAVILFVATPPIPGANFLAYIVLISALDINGDFLMLALIYEIIYGAFASAANQFFVQMEMALQAKKMGLLKENVLRREGKG